MKCVATVIIMISVVHDILPSLITPYFYTHTSEHLLTNDEKYSYDGLLARCYDMDRSLQVCGQCTLVS